ncbi:MAG TPA: adenosylmethionine decarboxylase [Pyrinomonadaceae bacterium]|nr:adenosylmethionine decarboxylase [Pyrinomonadaceae bacterium]
MLTVGTEWLIEASGCDAGALRDEAALREVFARAIRELELRVVGEQMWHKFPGEGGVTGLALLTESHLACHTYPELNAATFNLYCCRERAAWPWAERLREMLGAQDVSVRSLRRTAHAPSAQTHTPSAQAHASSGQPDAPSIQTHAQSVQASAPSAFEGLAQAAREGEA